MPRHIYHGLLTIVVLCSTVSASAGTYEVSGAAITHDGQEIQLFGVAWFGAETQDHVPHGLWTRGYQDMIQQIRGQGFNAIRLPFCPDTLQNVAPNSINYAENPELQGLGSLEILDTIVAELDRNQIYVLFDHHRPDCDAISELWYLPGYSEADWIADLVFVASRYASTEHFVGIDLKNEPHGAATWGTGNPATDWDLSLIHI